ncbi:MAG: hypothetical protein Ta2E_10960 [Mycoplasmoidaceae bacterium]|nr:MAG: hypothetical protein Ta2E_10960 [Mycoplasmoidaceae bacterium]
MKNKIRNRWVLIFGAIFLELFFGTIFWNYLFLQFYFCEFHLQFYFFVIFILIFIFFQVKMTNHLTVDFVGIFKNGIPRNDMVNIIKAVADKYYDNLFLSENVNIEIQIDNGPNINIDDTKISVKSIVRKDKNDYFDIKIPKNMHSLILMLKILNISSMDHEMVDTKLNAIVLQSKEYYQKRLLTIQINLHILSLIVKDI